MGVLGTFGALAYYKEDNLTFHRNLNLVITQIKSRQFQFPQTKLINKLNKKSEYL